MDDTGRERLIFPITLWMHCDGMQDTDSEYLDVFYSMKSCPEMPVLLSF